MKEIQINATNLLAVSSELCVQFIVLFVNSEKNRSIKILPGVKKYSIIVGIVLLGVVVGIYFFSYGKENKTKKAKPVVSSTASEPVFVQEGNLWFIANVNQDTLSRLSIEVADDTQQRTKGLMHRSNMPEDNGMLFVFENEAKRSFWMKNTIISLDILYVNQQKEIVTIYKHTQPYSENPIPSFKEAMYVVETVAGYCDRNNINEGDQIAFDINQ